MRKSVILLLLGMGVGCGAASALRHASAAHAYGANPAAPRWEQYCGLLDFTDVAAANTVLARRGAEGWELVGATRDYAYKEDYMFCFKRPAGPPAN